MKESEAEKRRSGKAESFLSILLIDCKFVQTEAYICSEQGKITKKKKKNQDRKVLEGIKWEETKN